MEIVIFDTNAYRYLIQDKSFAELDKYIKKIKSKEKKLSIQTYLSPIVAKELLAHIADKNDPSYEKCLKAIKAMYLHCSEQNGKVYRMLASPEMLIAKSFFNTAIPRKEETFNALIQIAFHLAKGPTEDKFRKFQKNLNQNRNHVLESENFFATSLYDFIKKIDPNSIGWNIFKNNQSKRTKLLKSIRSDEVSLELAGGFIYTVYLLLQSENLIKTQLTVEKLVDMSMEFVNFFPEYIALYKKVLENLVNSEFNLFENSRSNFLWDIQLMMNVGKHTINGQKLYFVTSDKAIIEAAITNNGKYSILTFDEYLDYIN